MNSCVLWSAFLGADASGGPGNTQGVRSPNVDRGASQVECVIFRLTCVWPGYIQDENRQRAGLAGFWTIEYYQPYFDVDTSTVCLLRELSIKYGLTCVLGVGLQALLFNPSSHLNNLSYYTPNPVRGPLRALLDFNNADIHALPFLFARFFHILVPFFSRDDIRVRLRAAQHQREPGVCVWTGSTRAAVACVEILWSRGVERR